MLSYRLGSVNEFHTRFKPVLSFSKPLTSSTVFGKEKEAEQNDWKVKRSKNKRKRMKIERILSTKVFCLWKSSQVRGTMTKARKKVKLL